MRYLLATIAMLVILAARGSLGHLPWPIDLTFAAAVFGVPWWIIKRSPGAR